MGEGERENSISRDRPRSLGVARDRNDGSSAQLPVGVFQREGFYKCTTRSVYDSGKTYLHKEYKLLNESCVAYRIEIFDLNTFAGFKKSHISMGFRAGGMRMLALTRRIRDALAETGAMNL